MYRHYILVLGLLMLCFKPALATATPFDQGTVNISVLVGSGRAYNDDYTVFGAGIGYYFLDGLQLGVDYEYWSGGEPTIQQVSPRINYVFSTANAFSPYIGVFYRRTSIDNLPDSDAYGGRAGAYMRTGGNLVLGFGVAYIEYQDCEESIYRSCSDTYPELTFGAHF